MSGTTVYVVTSGSYSDYGINAVFLDKAKAEEYVRRANLVTHADECVIEEWEADEPVRELVTRHFARWQDNATPGRYGYPAGLSESSAVVFADPKDARPTLYEAGIGASWSVYGTCTDRDLLLKAIHDRVAAHKARQAGIA